jgi:hypothetical protein
LEHYYDARTHERVKFTVTFTLAKCLWLVQSLLFQIYTLTYVAFSAIIKFFFAYP